MLKCFEVFEKYRSKTFVQQQVLICWMAYLAIRKFQMNRKSTYCENHFHFKLMNWPSVPFFVEKKEKQLEKSVRCRRQLFIHITTHKYAMHHFSRNSSTIENFWKLILFRATLNSIFSRVIRLKSQDRQILLFAIGILTLFECRLFAAFYTIACIQTMRYCLSVFLFFAKNSSLFHQLSSFFNRKLSA